MKKLQYLTERFAEDVFRVLRGATLEELADLMASPEAPLARGRASVSRAVGRASRTVRPSSRTVARVPARDRADVGRGRSGEGGAAHEPPAIAEITDPERLLRIETDTPSTAQPEPQPEPPPASTVQPSVLLRANEALVRASNAGIVIRRRKGA